MAAVYLPVGLRGFFGWGVKETWQCQHFLLLVTCSLLLYPLLSHSCCCHHCFAPDMQELREFHPPPYAVITLTAPVRGWSPPPLNGLWFC